MKIIFLDIDGVLNCEEGYLKRIEGTECKYVDFINRNGEKDYYQSFYSENKKWLNKLIKDTNAKIVVSSSWRGSGLNWLREVWELEKMEGEILDITPYLHFKDGGSAPRGTEIDKWLEDKGFRHLFWSKELQEKYVNESGIENYIIIDDDSDMLYNQRENFIHVLPSPRNKKGFTLEHYEKGVNVLNKNIIEMNYSN